MGQYVGIDLHRRSTTIVRMAEDGEVLGTERFVSQPFEPMAAARPEPEVVFECTYGWYWAADVLQELGAHVHLAHALGNNWGNRRVKNDVRDAEDLAAMLALGRCASWSVIATRSSGTGPVPRPRFDSLPVCHHSNCPFFKAVLIQDRPTELLHECN